MEVRAKGCYLRPYQRRWPSVLLHGLQNLRCHSEKEAEQKQNKQQTKTICWELACFVKLFLVRCHAYIELKWRSMHWAYQMMISEEPKLKVTMCIVIHLYSWSTFQKPFLESLCEIMCEFALRTETLLRNFSQRLALLMQAPCVYVCFQHISQAIFGNLFGRLRFKIMTKITPLYF